MEPRFLKKFLWKRERKKKRRISCRQGKKSEERSNYGGLEGQNTTRSQNVAQKRLNEFSEMFIKCCLFVCNIVFSDMFSTMLCFLKYFFFSDVILMFCQLLLCEMFLCFLTCFPQCCVLISVVMFWHLVPPQKKKQTSYTHLFFAKNKARLLFHALKRSRVGEFLSVKQDQKHKQIEPFVWL